jgi:hypothetical protein
MLENRPSRKHSEAWHTQHDMSSPYSDLHHIVSLVNPHRNLASEEPPLVTAADSLLSHGVGVHIPERSTEHNSPRGSYQRTPEPQDRPTGRHDLHKWIGDAFSHGRPPELGSSPQAPIEPRVPLLACYHVANTKTLVGALAVAARIRAAQSRGSQQAATGADGENNSGSHQQGKRRTQALQSLMPAAVRILKA